MPLPVAKPRIRPSRAERVGRGDVGLEGASASSTRVSRTGEPPVDCVVSMSSTTSISTSAVVVASRAAQAGSRCLTVTSMMVVLALLPAETAPRSWPAEMRAPVSAMTGRRIALVRTSSEYVLTRCMVNALTCCSSETLVAPEVETKTLAVAV